MVKIVQQSSWDGIEELGVSFVNDTQPLKKVASTIFGVDYTALKPDKDHVGIHLVALGDYEHYGLNRNYDGFSKESCQKYGDTFITNGHVFEHHHNNDPKKALGEIKMSAYNPAMGRQELFIHVHKDKGAEHLDKYEKTGSASFSMACHVLYDTCNLCGAERKSRSDDTTCDHLRYQFGKQASCGTIIGTMNPEPTWFDISFVTKPADRIAFDLKKVAEHGRNGVSDEEFRRWTYKLEQGSTVPSSIAMDSDTARTKLAAFRYLASVENQVRNEASGSGGLSKADRAYLTLVKSAFAPRRMSDQDVNSLRELPTQQAFYKLASDGVILSPTDFVRYVFGPNADKTDKMAAAIKRCGTIVAEIADNPVEVCVNDNYDILPGIHKIALTTPNLDLGYMAITGPVAKDLLILGNRYYYTNNLDKSATIDISCNNETGALAKEYIAYKVASLSYMANGKSDTDIRGLYTAAAVQNLYK